MNNFLKWILLGLFFSVAFKAAVEMAAPRYTQVSFSEFSILLEKGEIKSATIQDNHTIVSIISDKKTGKNRAVETTVDTTNPEVFKLLRDSKVPFNYVKPEKPSLLINLIFSLIPILLLFFFISHLMSKQTGGGGGGYSSFGRSNARSIPKSSTKVTFADVAGSDETKQELIEIVDFLKDPKKFTRLGGRIPKGVLMQGPPGTGKTLLARAVAGEANVPFLFISGSEFVEMFVGVGASRVRDLFNQAKRNVPCVIFIDEIDAVGKQRGSGMNGGHEEREQTLNQLLVEMDGFDNNTGVIIIAATNRADILDKALLRPGRFDRLITVSNPDVRGREAILKVHTKDVKLNSDVDLSVVAKGTSGFSGAELENLVNESALIAARKNKDQVDSEDFEYAKDKILMGVERKSLLMSEEERRTTAYHEAGHAIVGTLLKNVDPIHKVTIIPRGHALGLTQTLPEQDRVSMTRQRAVDMIAFLMGGRVAEEVALNQITTGAGNDIERATDIARKMVMEWGMSEKLGPINYNIKQTDFSEKPKSHSDSISTQIDLEIKLLIEDGHQTARRILKEHASALNRMATVLLEKETINSKEVIEIVSSS